MLLAFQFLQRRFCCTPFTLLVHFSALEGRIKPRQLMHYIDVSVLRLASFLTCFEKSIMNFCSFNNSPTIKKGTELIRTTKINRNVWIDGRELVLDFRYLVVN